LNVYTHKNVTFYEQEKTYQETIAENSSFLSQHWHTFALSAQIHICYTEDAQKHTKIESCCEQTPVAGVCFLHWEKKKEEHL